MSCVRGCPPPRSETGRVPISMRLRSRSSQHDLQKNVLDGRSWATREQARIAIVTWIEPTHHRRRRQERLGRLTPVEFETMMTKNLALAA